MIPIDLTQFGTIALYAVVFAVIFVETGLLVGIALPGDTVLFTAGLLTAGIDSPLALPAMILTALAAAILGDSLGYAVGKRLGRPYLVRSLRNRGTRMLDRAERSYQRHGAFALVAARWIPWIRTITPVLAGIGVMRYPTFLAANACGAVLWAVGLVILGHLADSIPWVYQLSLLAMALTIIAILGYAAYQWFRRRQTTRKLNGVDTSTAPAVSTSEHSHSGSRPVP
jgi:membrane-associated protein